jgi:hypothetical protein
MLGNASRKSRRSTKRNYRGSEKSTNRKSRVEEDEAMIVVVRLSRAVVDHRKARKARKEDRVAVAVVVEPVKAAINASRSQLRMLTRNNSRRMNNLKMH